MCKNANGFKNMISGNSKIAKALDIKNDLGIDCLMYCKHCLNLQHKDNKNDFKQMFQWEIACTAVAAQTHMKGNMRDGCRKAEQVLCASHTPRDTSRSLEMMTKVWVDGAGYCLEARTATILN
jgi:hypothetical protein